MFKARITWLAVGLVVGLFVALSAAGLWPQAPIHAYATHGHDNFAIATGLVDDNLEAIYFLDFLTGDLKAAVLNLQTRRFLTFYEYNVAKDFGGIATKNPRYLMVTGLADFRRSAGAIQLGLGVIYIAEATSGQIAVYALPIPSLRGALAGPAKGTFVALDKGTFRTTAIRKVE